MQKKFAFFCLDNFLLKKFIVVSGVTFELIPFLVENILPINLIGLVCLSIRKSSLGVKVVEFLTPEILADEFLTPEILTMEVKT